MWPVSYTHLDVYKRQAYNNADTKPRVLNDQLLFKSNILYDTALRYCRDKSQSWFSARSVAVRCTPFNRRAWLCTFKYCGFV